MEAEAARVDITRGQDRDEKLIPKLVKQINSNWEKGSQAILAIARLCSRAETELTPEGFARLVKQLKFDKSKCCKYAAIGRKISVWGDHIIKLLPSDSFSTLYEIAIMTEEHFHEAVTKGVINPSLTREEVLKLKRLGLPTSRGDDQHETDPSYRLHSRIKIQGNCSAEAAKSLTDGLIALTRECSAVLELEEDKLASAGEEYLKKFEDYVRTKARSAIKGSLEQVRNRQDKKTLTQETKIARHAPLSEVKANLELLSFKTTLNTTFGAIINDAYEKVCVPRLIEDVSNFEWTYSSGQEADDPGLDLGGDERSEEVFASLK